MRLRVRSKIFAFFAVVIGLLLTFVSVFLSARFKVTVAGDFAQRFEAGAESTRRMMDNRMKTLLDGARVLTSAPQIRPILETPDIDYSTIQYSFAAYKKSLTSDILVITDPSGKIKFWADKPDMTGQSIQDWAVVRDALNGKEATGVQTMDGNLYLLAAVPVYTFEGQFSAMLLAGARADQNTANEISQITSMDIAFTQERKILESNVLPEARARLGQALNAHTEPFSPGGAQDLNVQGEIYRCSYLPLTGEPGVGMLFLASQDAALRKLLNPAKRALRAVALIGLILAGIGSFFYAKSSTTPVRALVEGTKAVEENRWDYRIDFKQYFTDEFTDLKKSFNEMIASLAEKEEMRSVLHKAVSKEIAEAMMKQKELGGQERKVTMLFSDLRGFTSMSERLTPTQVITILNEYMTRMEKCVELNKGVVDKFVGDEIMALFGAPISAIDDAERACRTALLMKERLIEYNKERVARGDFEIHMGIGINTGRVVAGIMGSQQRQDYTVIGAACNLAARLCGAAAAEQILVAESTYHEVKDIFKFNKLEPIRVKNVAQPVPIYELLS